jgi:cell division protein FtsI (penicillin-binding protein 3)
MSATGDRQIAHRGRVWSAIAAAFFLALAGRLWSLQVTHHEHYLALGERSGVRRWPIPAPRGAIFDRNGEPLAVNLKLYSVAADPGCIKDAAKTAAQLSPLLRKSAREIEQELKQPPGVRWVLLKRSVDEPLAAAIRRLRDPGLIIVDGWRRVYPQRELAGAVLGFVGADGKGLAGVEAGLDRRLSGVEGEMQVVLDGRRPGSRDQIPGLTQVRKAMVPGSSVVLTLDVQIQAIVEEELKAAVEAAGAAGGTAVAMDPQTGEVLALATVPGFDPNDYRSYPRETWVSNAVAAPYEPGSTFKLVTACAALEEGVMSRGETVTCEGSRRVGNRTISCALHHGSRAHGTLDLDGMVVESCNVGMATVALKLGADRMHRWARRFGFGERTGIEIPGESPGMLSPPGRWPDIQVANIGFGQGVSVTPLQLLAAYCAVANGGRRVYPHLVRTIRDAAGKVEHPPVREGERILSRETCDHMKRVLERVVEEGTGTAAAIANRRVAGKTGTAQKARPGAGYSSNKHIASFVGFSPVDDPRLAVLVVIDEPTGSQYGGTVAAPVFRAICERVLTYLRVPPDRPVTEQAAAGQGYRGSSNEVSPRRSRGA